uniref:Calmin n=1 Tax=Anabas testudineus TaxID=64144 RepID=A0A7N6FA52_ANATE
MAGHEWEDWFEREELIGQISDIRVQNLQVEREVVQKRTFTRWMNLHLEKCNPPIEVHDLFRDIQGSSSLQSLDNVIRKLFLIVFQLHGFKKSSHRIFRLNNIAKVLSFLEERNVKLVSIDAADVADGNPSIVLGLIWNIILFFQIKELTGNIRSQFPSSSSLSSIPTSSDSDTSYCSTPSDERQSASTAMREHSKAIKKLLQWVQKRTRKYGVAIQDFGKSWTSGLAFLAVIKSIDSSLVDMRKALLRSPRENMEDAFRIAHYSLGIPRLLDPEDVTINAPDQQCIITYVSQFLEHFPGLEEVRLPLDSAWIICFLHQIPEEPSQIIERSVSMGRLNFRDSDYHMKNGAHQSRVKERSYIFQRDYTHPPPKILISSVSEDRGAMSPPFRPAAARSWSSEDFLADSPHVEDIYNRVVEDPKEPVSEVLTNSTSNSTPQLSHIHSPTGSSVPDSVTEDSAINSPDSWVESEFGVIPEKFCESRSDSSLCDSGTAWDVYRATPVEVTTLDEGFVPSMEDKSTDQHFISESSIDEAICSLSSLESTQEQIQEQPEKNVEVVKEEGENRENYNQDNTVEQVPDQSKTEVTKEVDANPMNMSILEKDEVARQQEPSRLSETLYVEVLANSGVEEHLDTDSTNQPQHSPKNELPSLDHSEELIKQTSLEKSTDQELESLKDMADITGDGQGHEGKSNGQVGLNERNNSKDTEFKNEYQKGDSPLEDKREDPTVKLQFLKKRDEGVVETPEKSEGVLIDCRDEQQSIKTENSDALANTPPTNHEEACQASLEQSIGKNIPLISISSEPEEQNEEGTCDLGGQAHAGDEEVQQTEITGNNGTDTDVNSPQKPDELKCDSSDNDDKSPVEVPSCLSGNVKTGASEQNRDIKNGQLEDTDERDTRNCSNVDTKDPYTTDHMEISEGNREFPHDNTLTDNIDKGLTAQTSKEIKTEQKKPNETCPQIETASTHQSTLNPLNSESSGKTGILCYEPASVSRNMDSFYADFDRSSPIEDLVGHPIEPMDLFYPDKEEPMFTEPLDTEMQSWPSVLSVSALEPAPASEALVDDKPLNLLMEDLRDGVDVMQENDKVNVSLFSSATIQQLQFQCVYVYIYISVLCKCLRHHYIFLWFGSAIIIINLFIL